MRRPSQVCILPSRDSRRGTSLQTNISPVAAKKKKKSKKKANGQLPAESKAPAVNGVKGDEAEDDDDEEDGDQSPIVSPPNIQRWKGCVYSS